MKVRRKSLRGIDPPPPRCSVRFLTQERQRGVSTAWRDESSVSYAIDTRRDGDYEGQAVEWGPAGGVIAVSVSQVESTAAANSLLLGYAGFKGTAAFGLPAVLSLTTGVYATLFSVIVPDGYRFVCEAVRIGASSLEAARATFRISISGKFALLPVLNAVIGERMPISFVAEPGEVATLEIACQDDDASFLLFPRFEGRLVRVGEAECNACHSVAGGGLGSRIEQTRFIWFSGTLADGQNLWQAQSLGTLPLFRALGAKKIHGFFSSSLAAAAGFPVFKTRVKPTVASAQDISLQIVLDPTSPKPPYTYSFEVELDCPDFTLDFQNVAGSGAANFIASAFWEPE